MSGTAGRRDGAGDNDEGGLRPSVDRESDGPAEGWPRSSRLILVGGGARSGKSRFALGRARLIGPRRVFLATAEALDEEMGSRIARHRAERGEDSGFVTHEEPIEVVSCLRGLVEGPRPPDVVLLDCLTLWLSNLLCRDVSADDVLTRVEDLVGVLVTASARGTATVVVTNEVGFGLVPETPLGRAFRDLAGFAHQRLADVADEIHVALLGRVLQIHPLPLAVRAPRVFEASRGAP